MTELAGGWILSGTDVGSIGEMTVGEDDRYVVYEGRIAKCGVPLKARMPYTKEGSDMPYIARDTSVIYAAADTAAAALAEAEKDLRARLPTEDIQGCSTLNT